MLYITPGTLAYLRDHQRRFEARERIRLAHHKVEKPRCLSVKVFAAAVEYVGRILRTGEPTKFQHEGACRAGFRVALINKGWRWSDADREAMRVVGSALLAIGARRPSWMQGQPEYRERDHTDWRYRHCLTCGGMLDEDHSGRHCSRECASVTAKRTWARENKDRVAALQKAWAAANPEKRKANQARQIERADPRDCQHCGKTFRVENSQKDRFCSQACGYAARSAAAAKRNEKQCAYCLGPFVARSRGGTRLHIYCSRECSNAGRARGATTTIFKCEEAV